MTTSATSPGTIHPSRALEPARVMLPSRSSGRALAVRVAQHAVPVIARSVAAGMAVLAVEQAVRRFVDGATGRAVAAPRVEATPAPTGYIATYSITETVVIERVRRRR